MIENREIPHIIHYCWFGGKKKPLIIQKCIKTWRDMYPDWEIIEWNETNYDVHKNKYIDEAYKQKKWAFVADYARFDILNQYGGINLDTDVKVIKRIPKELLALEAFTGFESGGKVAPGLIFASQPHTEFLNNVLEMYDNMEYNQDFTICDIVTELLNKQGLICDNSKQTVCNVTVFPEEFFCAFDHETQLSNITEETISTHLYFASWAPKRNKIKYKVIKCVALFLGKDRYLNIKNKIKKHLV